MGIIEVGMELRRHGTPEFHGFLLSKALADAHGARLLTAYGTLYRALDRLERAGYLESRWEDPLSAAADGRPRRRFYRLTLAAERALAEKSTRSPGQVASRRLGEAAS